MESSAKKRKPSAVSVFEEAKPKRQLTIRERQQIIDLVESGKKHCEVRDMCPVQLTPNAIGFIMKNKMRYKSITDETTLDRAPSRDRRLTESGKIIDVHMKKWLDDMLKDGKTVTGPMMRTRAKEMGEEFGLTEFKAASGWLDRFLVRHRIRTGDDDESQVVRKPRRRKKKKGEDPIDTVIQKIPNFPTDTDVDRALRIMANYSYNSNNAEMGEKTRALRFAFNRERRAQKKTTDGVKEETRESTADFTETLAGMADLKHTRVKDLAQAAVTDITYA